MNFHKIPMRDTINYFASNMSFVYSLTSIRDSDHTGCPIFDVGIPIVLKMGYFDVIGFEDALLRDPYTTFYVLV